MFWQRKYDNAACHERNWAVRASNLIEKQRIIKRKSKHCQAHIPNDGRW